MAEIPRRATLASARTRSALTRPPRPPSHAAPRTPAMSAPSAAALGRSSTVNRPASAAVSPAACAVSTHCPSASSSINRKRPGPLLSLVSSKTPHAPHRSATAMTSCQHRSAYAAKTIAHPETSVLASLAYGSTLPTSSFAKATRANEPTGATAPSPSAALIGRRPPTLAIIAASVRGETGPSAPRAGSLASMISAPPSTAAFASAAFATLTKSCMLAYVKLCR